MPSSTAESVDPRGRAGWPLLAAGLALIALGLASALALRSAGRGEWAHAFVRAYTLAWFCYLPAALIATRVKNAPRWWLFWIVVAALGLRIVALETRLPLTTDYWRYLWDGRVSNAGVNPYLYPPNAPELSHLRDSNWEQIWHKEIPTIYPPTAELLFAGVARLHPSDPELFRWLFVFCDLASILLLIALLRRTGRPPERVIWYAWCPLPITEAAIGLHVDCFGLLLLLLAFWFASRRDSQVRAASAVTFAGAVLAKGFALPALPFFIKRGGARALGWFGLACLLLLAPYIGIGRRLFTGLSEFMGHWETNSSIFFFINWNLTPITEYHFAIARGVTAIALITLVAWLVWRQQPGLEWLMGATFATICAQLLLGAPTMPWYGIWTTPLLCWWSVPGWLLLTLTLSLQYYVRWLYPGNIPVHHTLLWAGYLPVYALLIAQFLCWRLRSRRSAPSHTT
jgi:hypothetical protein